MPFPVAPVTSIILSVIEFVITREDLKGKTPEQILALWQQNAQRTQEAIDAWKAAGGSQE